MNDIRQEQRDILATVREMEETIKAREDVALRWLAPVVFVSIPNFICSWFFFENKAFSVLTMIPGAFFVNMLVSKVDHLNKAYQAKHVMRRRLNSINNAIIAMRKK